MIYPPGHRFNTNNPLGSNSPFDLYDNAGITDHYLNDLEEEYWDDRFGRMRLTWGGMELQFEQAQDGRTQEFQQSEVQREAEFQVSQQDKEDRFQQFLADSGYVDLGDYDADGPLTITARNEIFSKDGEYYRIRPGVALPYTTTGVWATDQADFVAIGDAALRQELASPTGDDLVNGGTLIRRDTIDNMAQLSGSSGQAVHVVSTGRFGVFPWISGDLSAEVAADTERGIYVPPAGQDGSLGAWVRLLKHAPTPEDFGAWGDGQHDDTDACRGWMDYLIGRGYCEAAAPGKYLVEQIAVRNTDNLTIHGGTWTKAYSTGASLRHIFFVENSKGFFVQNATLVGTADESPIYDLAVRNGGMYVVGSSFCGLVGCDVTKFTSYGIMGLDLNGGTYTEGVFVDRCRFYDFPYDAATAHQSGVVLASDGEYSTVTNNRFFRMPSAARFIDGANSLFGGNIVMQLNSEFSADRAAVYQEPGSNSGKLQVVGNKFNHIESGQYVVLLKGDAAKPQNPMIIAGNEFLVSGAAATNGRLITLVDAPNSRILNNSLRPAGNTAGHASVRVVRSDNTVIDDNHFNAGDYAIEADNSKVIIGTKNIFNNQASGKVLLSNGGSVSIPAGRGLGFRVSESGAAGSHWDDPSVTVARPEVGHYVLTHNFGSNQYACNAETDNSMLAPERRFSFVRGENQLDIYITDGSDTPISENFMLTVNLARNNPYIPDL